MVPGAQLRNKPDAPSLWNSTIRLGEAFFNEIITQDLSGPGSTAVRFPETRGTPCARSLLRKRGRDARPCGLTGAAGWPRAPAHAGPGHATTGGYDGRRRPGGTARCDVSPVTVRPRDVASRRSGFDACQPVRCQWRANGFARREADAFPVLTTAGATGSRPPRTTRPARHRRCHGNSARRDLASRRSAPSGHVADHHNSRKGVPFQVAKRSLAIPSQSPLGIRSGANGGSRRRPDHGSAVRNLARQSRWPARRPWAKVATWGPGPAPQTDAHPGDPNP